MSRANNRVEATAEKFIFEESLSDAEKLTLRNLIGAETAGSKVIHVSKATVATDTRTGLSKYDPFVPFATLTAAKDAAESGDLIVVLPGVYTGRGLLKNGVDWYFTPNASIHNTDATEHPLEAIFDDGVGGSIGENFVNSTSTAVVCKVTGHGDFKDEGWTGCVLRLSNSASEVLFEFRNASVIRVDVDSVAAVFRIRTDGAAPFPIVHAKGDLATSIHYDVIWGGGSDSTFHIKRMLCADNCVEDTIGLVVSDYLGGMGEDTGVAITAFSGTAIIGTIDKAGGAGVLEFGGQIKCNHIIAQNSDVDAPVILGAGCIAEIALLEMSGSNPAVVLAAGAELRNSRIQCTNANSHSVLLDGSGGKIHNSILVAGSSANSIAGTDTVKVMNVFANKAVAGGVTQQVGTVTVDANVS
jgi:hypothetical protein